MAPTVRSNLNRLIPGLKKWEPKGLGRNRLEQEEDEGALRFGRERRDLGADLK